MLKYEQRTTAQGTLKRTTAQGTLKRTTIKTLLHFCQYTISFFKSKSMSILSRSDISSNQCKFMFAILLQLLLLFLYKFVFAYVIRIVDLSFICK